MRLVPLFNGSLLVLDWIGWDWIDGKWLFVTLDCKCLLMIVLVSFRSAYLSIGCSRSRVFIFNGESVCFFWKVLYLCSLQGAFWGS